MSCTISSDITIAELEIAHEGINGIDDSVTRTVLVVMLFESYRYHNLEHHFHFDVFEGTLRNGLFEKLRKLKFEEIPSYIPPTFDTKKSAIIQEILSLFNRTFKLSINLPFLKRIKTHGKSK